VAEPAAPDATSPDEPDAIAATGKAPAADGPAQDAAAPDAPAANAPAATTPAADSLVVHLDGFDGPLDLLLELARGQKLDLAKISILSLVDQYLTVIEGARQIRLELAADWLVMAAWLTWLKSRLLLPAGSAALEEAELAAEVLASRLRDLQAIRAGAAWLAARPLLGYDVFARGAPEDMTETDRTRLVLDLPSLMRGFLVAMRRGAGTGSYRPAVVTLWTIKDALARLAHLVGSLPDWTTLEKFLPDTASPLQRRAALASTLVAGLEMARHGTLRLRQEEQFGPILLRRVEQPAGGPEETDERPES
jgi:segregation and condensation protein A